MASYNTITRGQLNDAIADQAQVDLDVDGDALAVSRWRMMGLALMENAQDWWFLKTYAEITLSVSLTFDLPAGFQKIAGNSLFFSNNRPVVFVEDPEEIDRNLGPEWKLSSHAGGSVEMATILGSSLYLAFKPNAAFVAANPTLGYYYYKAIDPGTLAQQVAAATDADTDTTALNLPTNLLPYALRAALIYGMQREDDTTLAMQIQEFKNDVVQMRGLDHAVFDREPIKRPQIRSRGQYRGGRRRY